MPATARRELFFGDVHLHAPVGSGAARCSLVGPRGARAAHVGGDAAGVVHRYSARRLAGAFGLLHVIVLHRGAPAAAALGGVGALVRGLEERHQPPGGEDARAARADERQRDAGKRQHVGRAEDVEAGLEQKQAGRGAGGDRVERGAAARHVAARVQDEQRDAREHDERHQQALLLTEHAENEVAVGGRHVFQVAVADAHAEQTAARYVGQRARLLVAEVVGGFPHVQPAGKALRHVRQELYDKQNGEDRRRKDQENRAEAARAHEGDDQEGREEDQRGAHVLHQHKEAEAGAGKHDELRDVLFRLQMVERRGADKDEGDLDELRGLDADRPDDDPVFRAVVFGADQDVQHKEQNRADGDVEPRLHHAVEIAQEPDEEAEEEDAENHRGDLRLRGVQPLPAQKQDADAAQKQRHGFNLKADAL